MEAIDAFSTVYFDDATSVDDFGALLTETIGILTQIAANGGADDDDETMKAIEKLLAGRARNSAVAGLAKMLNKSALGSLALSEGGVSGARDNAGPTRSRSSEALKEVNSFVETRELLRSVNLTVEKALQNFNRAARNRK